ncbi:Alpha-maltose-1-phosphate synthase [Candidatus Brocadiaceae bacterium]|nr:Alpha-maltose-1-phosphate synthase [Candidatus Brocadiaceae bacterium]
MKALIRSLWSIIARSIANLLIFNLKLYDDKSILFIVPWLTFGGAEKVNLEIMEALKKENWNIFIVTTKASRHEWENLFKKYSDHIWHIDNIPQKLHSYIFLSMIRKAGIKVTFISNSFTGYLAIPHISQYSKIVDLVHAEGGPEDDGGSAKFSSTFDQYITKRIVISERLENIYVNEYKIEQSKIKVIRNGIDVAETINETKEAVFPTAFNSILDKSRKVVWVGRMSEEKQPLEVIKLAKKMPNYYFIIVGDGDMYSQVAGEAENIENVILLGQLENNVSRKIIASSDILIMTSRYEGVPIVILEAMALSKPVVATDVGAINEMVQTNINGYLVELIDMPAYIEKAYNNKIELGENGLEIVEAKFSKSLMQEEYLKLFNSLLNE